MRCIIGTKGVSEIEQTSDLLTTRDHNQVIPPGNGKGHGEFKVIGYEGR